MTTQSITGLIGSDTSACRQTLSTGMRTPAISMMFDVWPDVTTATFLARMVPRFVATPVIFRPDPDHPAIPNYREFARRDPTTDCLFGGLQIRRDLTHGHQGFGFVVTLGHQSPFRFGSDRRDGRIRQASRARPGGPTREPRRANAPLEDRGMQRSSGQAVGRRSARADPFVVCPESKPRCHGTVMRRGSLRGLDKTRSYWTWEVFFTESGGFKRFFVAAASACPRLPG